MTRWEYALVYLRQGEGVQRRRWILFSHEQEARVLNRLPAIVDQSSPSNNELDAERASTTVIMGVLGEDGWELVATNSLPHLDAACLYFKREIRHRARLATPPS